MKTAGIALLALGLPAMGYGGFSDTRDWTTLKAGQIELSVKERQRVNVPSWAGVLVAAAGGLFLVAGSRKP